MRIKVYTFATDDAAGTNGYAYATEEERDDAFFSWLGENRSTYTAWAAARRLRGEAADYFLFADGRMDHMASYDLSELYLEVPDQPLHEV